MMVEVLGAFADRPPERAPIVIVTADHGEALGDHGQPYHSTDLYNSQIHVPLVIAGPGIKPGPRDRDREPDRPRADACSSSPASRSPRTAASTGARSPISRWASGDADPDGGIAFAAMIKDRSNPGGITAVVRGGWKLIDNGATVELYDIHDDPDEKTNLATAKPQIFDELRKLLKDHVDAARAIHRSTELVSSVPARVLPDVSPGEQGAPRGSAAAAATSSARASRRCAACCSSSCGRRADHSSGCWR